MKHLALLLGLTLAWPAVVDATTIASTRAYGISTVGDVRTEDVVVDRADLGTPDTDVAVEAEAPPVGGIGEARGSAASDYAADTLSAMAEAGKAVGGPPSLHSARGFAGQSGKYVAEGAGTVRLTYTVAGMFSVLSDRADAADLAHVFAGFDLDAPGQSFTERFSNRNPLDALFGAVSGDFTRSLVAEFDVDDGDTFFFFPNIMAEAGDLVVANPVTKAGFYDAQAEISGFFMFETKGTTIRPDLPPGDAPAPAPLPASLPLILAALGLLRLNARRHPA